METKAKEQTSEKKKEKKSKHLKKKNKRKIAAQAFEAGHFFNIVLWLLGF